VLAVLLTIILSLIVCGYVGLRLLLLARRTGKVPELCVGAGFLAFGLAQASRLVFGALGVHLGPEVVLGVYVFMQAGYMVAQGGLCLFTLITFGPKSRSRWALLAVIVGLNVISRLFLLHAAAPHLLGGGDSVPPVPFWSTAAVASFALGFGWMSFEALMYHSMLRRRLVLGLADPVVTNRFFVWGMGTGATCILVVILTGLYLEGHTLMTNSPAASLVVTLCGVGYTVVPWLTFVPPGAYLRFVQRRAARKGFGGT
jgi:hypothetical protein